MYLWRDFSSRHDKVAELDPNALLKKYCSHPRFFIASIIEALLFWRLPAKAAWFLCPANIEGGELFTAIGIAG